MSGWSKWSMWQALGRRLTVPAEGKEIRSGDLRQELAQDDIHVAKSSHATDDAVRTNQRDQQLPE
jgi:hypothetical protein